LGYSPVVGSGRTVYRDQRGLGGLVALLAVACAYKAPQLDASRHSDGGDVTPLIPIVVQPVYPSSPSWNDYVKNDGEDIFHGSGAPCDGSELGYFSCLHGGELRQVTLAGETICTALKATDAIGAFVWICREDPSGVTFYSVGFKPGMGLRDLVKVDGWLGNKVSVYRNSTIIARATPTAWWTNRVTRIPTNTDPSSAALPLADAGVVYVGDGQLTTSGYNIQADKVSVVTLKDAYLGYNGNAALNCTAQGAMSGDGPERTVLCAGDRKFLWIEADLRGSPANAPTLIAFLSGSVPDGGVVHSRIHASEFSGAVSANVEGNAGLRARLLWSSLLSDSRAFNNANTGAIDQGSGFWLHMGRFNTLVRLVSANNTGRGLLVDGPSFANAIAGLTVYENGGIGVDIYGSYDNVLTNVVAFNNSRSGIFIGVSSFRNYLTAVTAVSNLDANIELVNTATANAINNLVLLNSHDGIHFITGASSNRLVDTVVAHNSQGIEISADSPPAIDNQFRGTLWIGNNYSPTTDCVVATGATGNELSGDCNHGLNPVAAEIRPFDAHGAVMGWLQTADTKNAHTSTTLGCSEITDWAHFSSPWRGWSVGAASDFDFLTAANGRHGSSTPSCRMIDLALLTGDDKLRGAYGTFTADRACPTSVDANVAANVLTAVGGGAPNYLRAAVELVGDLEHNSSGNQNGLCESNEGCLFTPNRGAYQGQGYLFGPCTFTDGSMVAGVNLYAWQTNGE
jgi:hypothetical protein